MAKPAAKLIKEKNEKKEKQMYFQTTSLGRAFSDARILAHESVFDEMVEYTQLLKDFQDTYEKEDEKKLQEMIDRLAKLPDFLAMKDEEGQSVYDTVTQEMKPQQKWLFERNLTEACAKLDIYLDMEKITGKPKTIEVDGVVYTKQAFREKMYKNNWLEGADDLAIDRVFEGYYASMNDAKNMFKRLVPKMKKILDTPVPQDRQNGYKYENINSIMGDTTGSSIYKDQLNDVCVMYTAKAKKETHEVDKAAYLKGAAKKGWDHAGDEAFLSAAYELRFENGVYKKEIDRALDLLASDVIPRKEGQSYSGMMERENRLRGFRESLMKVPEAERSTAMKKTLEETQKQIDRCEHIREAYKYADNVVDMELWCGSDADNRKLFRDMYLAAEGLGEDHPYVQQLKLIGEGRSGIYPEYDLEKGQQGTIAATQTVAELQKAAEILQQSEIHTPAMEQAIAGINKQVDAIRNHHQYRTEQDSFEELMAWAHVTPEQKQNLKDFAETLEKAAGKADLPEDEKRQIKQLQEYAENAAKYKRDPNWYELQNGSEGIQKLEEILPAFIGERGTHHRLYDSAMKVLNDLAPEKAKEAEKAAKQTTKDYKEQLELSEEERVAAQQKLLQQQMDSFEKDLAGFKMMKENLDKVKKSYFRHDNSSLYTNMVNKVDDLCAATDYYQMEQLKGELKQLTTDYLDHTTLKRASSVHPNAETRRLCAFQMLAMTDEETYNKYSTDANKLRDKDNQITKERLASIPGVGQPLRNKTSIKEMMAQDVPAKKEHKSHAALQPTGPVADTGVKQGKRQG